MSSPIQSGVIQLRVYKQWMTPLPVYYTYVLATVNILASTPAIRRMLVNLNECSPFRRKWFLTVFSAVLCCAITGLILPAAVHSKIYSDKIHDVYIEAQHTIAEAKLTNNVAGLAQIADMGAELGEPCSTCRRTIADIAQERLGHIVRAKVRLTCFMYLGICFAFIVCSVLPAFALHRHVSRRMVRLQIAASGSPRSSDYPAPSYDVQLHPPSVAVNQINRDLLRLNRERPFANTITLSTPVLPPRYQQILESKQSTEEQLRNLQARLHAEARYTAAYIVMLLLLSSYTMFIGFRYGLSPS